MTDYTGDEGFEAFAEALEKAAKRDAKKRRRAAVGRQAAALGPSYLKEAGEEIQRKLLADDMFKDAEKVFCYVSVKNEPATDMIIEQALRIGKEVYVPRCLGQGIMEAVRISGTEDLSARSRFGIPEPAAGLPVGEAEEMDLLVVPCVAATRDGARLGHGMGYYDRFLERAAGRTVVLCYERLLQERIPEEAHDRRPDAVLTEEMFYMTK